MQFSITIIIISYTDKVVSAPEIQLCENGCTPELFVGRGDERKWMRTTYRDGIEPAEINEINPVFLFDKKE